MNGLRWKGWKKTQSSSSIEKVSRECLEQLKHQDAQIQCNTLETEFKCQIQPALSVFKLCSFYRYTREVRQHEVRAAVFLWVAAVRTRYSHSQRLATGCSRWDSGHIDVRKEKIPGTFGLRFNLICLLEHLSLKNKDITVLFILCCDIYSRCSPLKLI